MYKTFEQILLFSLVGFVTNEKLWICLGIICFLLILSFCYEKKNLYLSKLDNSTEDQRFDLMRSGHSSFKFFNRHYLKYWMRNNYEKLTKDERDKINIAKAYKDSKKPIPEDYKGYEDCYSMD